MTKNNPSAGMEVRPAMTTPACRSGLEPFNTYELHVVESLFAWVAEQQDAAPETVRSVTEASFGADDVGAIPRKSYDEVVRFLLDLRLDDILN